MRAQRVCSSDAHALRVAYEMSYGWLPALCHTFCCGPLLADRDKRNARVHSHGTHKSSHNCTRIYTNSPNKIFATTTQRDHPLPPHSIPCAFLWCCASLALEMRVIYCIICTGHHQAHIAANKKSRRLLVHRMIFVYMRLWMHYYNRIRISGKGALCHVSQHARLEFPELRLVVIIQLIKPFTT